LRCVTRERWARGFSQRHLRQDLGEGETLNKDLGLCRFDDLICPESSPIMTLLLKCGVIDANRASGSFITEAKLGRVVGCRQANDYQVLTESIRTLCQRRSRKVPQN
jgi:hypothetical protein